MHANALIDFLRAYGPAATSNNMYDEHVVDAAARYGTAPLEVEAQRLADLVANFTSGDPVNVILTGTAGAGKTYHCRRLFLALGGTAEDWTAQHKHVDIGLPASPKRLRIIKDLSELTDRDKEAELLDVAAALRGGPSERVYLIAANDGQLLKYWRDFGAAHPDSANLVATLLRMLQEERETDPDGAPALRLINLSRQPHHAVFEQLLGAVLEHQGWSGCEGCELLAESSCPIRRNREILRARGNRSPRLRLGEVIRLAAANDMHLPMRQVLVLIVNMLLGDKIGQKLLTCRTARYRAGKEACDATNPFDNALGINLRPKDRGQYHVFTALEAFGLGRETNNAIDALLIDRLPEESHERLVADDCCYGAVLFQRWRQLYRRGELDDAFGDFRAALEAQRRRLFFTLPSVDYGLSNALDPWKLTVFEHGSVYLAFRAGLEQGDATAMRIAAELLRGLNRTFTGRMCEDADALWLAAPAANSSEQLGRVLECEPLPFGAARMMPCRVTFDAEGLHGRPRLTSRVRDGEIVAKLELRPLMFEYLMRVANGSLPASFSRQCFEELRHFRLGLTGKLRDLDLIDPNDLNQVALVRLSYRGTLQQERLQASVGGVP